MAAFTSLQHVQILRLQDRDDGMLLTYIGRNPDTARPLVDLKWGPACVHAVKSIGQALLQANSPFTRFSGPQMIPQSALTLTSTSNSNDINTSLAERLTCLELNFVEGPDLNDRMRELSTQFRKLFTQARNIQGIHVGFPTKYPLDLSLEDVFHEVNWEKLRAFGVQSWRLHADEIIKLARRHRQTLRGLRLRDVLLRDGSMWRDVLGMLRAEMQVLDWVSLRRIDYSSHFDAIWAGSVEVFDDHPLLGGAQIDSSEDDEDEEFIPGPLNANEIDEGFTDDESDVEDDDHGPGANELALSPDTPASVPWSFSSNMTSYHPKTADELGDSGLDVLYEQRKYWEHWVVARPK